MAKEQRLKKEDNGEEAEEAKELTQADEKKDGDESEEVEPPSEECFEYKLAGVTVHSGTAHAGHYWAYINTKRGKEETPEGADDQTWASTEGDRWMEFNDSMVRPFQESKLKEECFGGEQSSSGGFSLAGLEGWGFGGGGGSYGKSGYMLFYERRKKKPLKVLEPQGKDEEEKTAEVDYREIVKPDDVPNQIFRKVVEDNRKFGFESDVYSREFFDFVLEIMKSSAAMEGNSPETQSCRRRALEFGGKVTLELLAKAQNNNFIDEHVAVLV